jgi:hypothetical protein
MKNTMPPKEVREMEEMMGKLLEGVSILREDMPNWPIHASKKAVLNAMFDVVEQLMPVVQAVNSAVDSYKPPHKMQP